MNIAIATMVQCFDFAEAGSGMSITTLSQQLQCRPVLKRSSYTHLCLPPSPPALPLIGHPHLLSPTVHNLAEISSKYGPLLLLRNWIYVLHSRFIASVATEMFKKHDINFSFLPKSAFRDTILFGDSGFVAAPDEDYWKFMKKLCVTQLLGVRHIERSLSVRREELLY
ncbi:cytochrome P450 705A20-like [Mangifera indica]|uniref:cytochrome P450 705A20-like n=1 Tax=Mangifera indica TaxID=29780 RepID=UPI001CF9BAEB|nr:cytochrome P450 705A20-like [Mangifera indica]